MEGDEEEALSYGVHRTYTETNLRYSQMAPLTMFEEVNTGNNLPVQFDIMAAPGEHHADELHLMFVAKGGGSANKTFLFQETRAILTPEKLVAFLETKMKTLGTSACPPYHLAIVIGGTSAESTLKTVKLASTKWLDTLPTTGSKAGHAFRDLEMEQKVLEISAQHRHRRAVRRQVFLPRRAGDPPAPPRRQPARGHRRLVQRRPADQGQDHARRACSWSSWRPTRRKYLPETTDEHLGGEVVAIDLNRPMAEIRRQLSALSGEDAAGADRHDGGGARHRARQAEGAAGSRRRACREYLKDHPVYYAGPAKTPDGHGHRQLRPHHGGADGQLRGRFPGRRRLVRHAGQGQPLARR